ncbi:MAG: HesA/MoeB/ThiF family protein [Flavobacteriales bacterium]|nr:HesA/MoeB/ThiF family protein [Flavobacteriales bacterium]
MNLSRYAKQVIVEGFGAGSQARLSKGRALIIGAGGLGTPVATLLAATGVGNITIVDGDLVEHSNLHRQFHYFPTDVGMSKAAVLSSRLATQNPEVRLRAITKRFTGAEKDLVDRHDIVCDCTDNLEARIAIDKACGSAGVPLVFAAVREWVGYLTVLHHHHCFSLSDAFDLEAYYADAVMNCEEAGIMPSTAMVLGGMQANEALKVLLGRGGSLDGKLLCVDLNQHVHRVFRLRKHGAQR